jgi:hypothetical protein
MRTSSLSPNSPSWKDLEVVADYLRMQAVPLPDPPLRHPRGQWAVG